MILLSNQKKVLAQKFFVSGLSLFSKNRFSQICHASGRNNFRQTTVTFWEVEGSQCDQMDRLFFNIWTFTSMKTCPIAFKICQSRFQNFPKQEIIPQKITQDFVDFPKWQNFTKSGHTEGSQSRPLFSLFLYCFIARSAKKFLSINLSLKEEKNFETFKWISVWDDFHKLFVSRFFVFVSILEI